MCFVTEIKVLKMQKVAQMRVINARGMTKKLQNEINFEFASETRQS